MQLNNIRTVNVPSIGKLPLSEKGNTFTPSGKKREHKAGRIAQDGGWVETESPAKLELTINLQKGVSLAALNAVSSEDITVRLANGEVHMLSQAFNTEAVPVNDGEGKVVFMSNISEQIG